MMRARMRRTLPALLLASAALAQAGPAAAQCLMNCDFSIKGKKGKFVEKQVTAADLAKADAAMTAGASQGRGLDESSLNRSANAGSGLHMPQTEKALMAMLKRIEEKWPYRSPGPVSIRITASTSFSPVAKPDKVIVVPLGLLMLAGNDDDVAWVLAHEYAHIALGHFSREAKQRQLTSGVDKLVSCTRTAMALSELRPQNNGGRFSFTTVKDEGARSMSRQALLRGDNIADLLEIYNQQLSKQQEDEADVAGFDLAIAAGYSDTGFGDALVVVENEEKRHGTLLDEFSREMSSYAKTAAGQSAAKALQGGNIQDALKGFLGDMAKNALTMAQDKLMDMMKQSHRPAKKRREGMFKYVDSAWKNDSFADSSHAWLDAVRQTAEFKEGKIAVQAIDNSTAAQQAMGDTLPTNDAEKLAYVQKLEKAIVALQPALATRYVNTPIVANAQAGLLVLANRPVEADRYFDMAAAAPLPLAAAPTKAAPARAKKPVKGRKVAVPAAPPPPAEAAPRVDAYLQQSLSGFDEHVDFLVRQRGYPKALKVIALAKGRFGDDMKFLPYMITIYTQTRQKELLLATINRCTGSQDKQLQERCMRAIAAPELMDKIDQLPPHDQDAIRDKFNAVYADARMASTCGIVDPAKVKQTKSLASALD